MSDTYDSPWKEILEQFFPDFLEFFFPTAYRDIDWDQGYESLDKELGKILRDAEIGGRVADKLIKVCCSDEQTRCVLIHTELQNEIDPRFEERMFTYSYRIYDRYQLPVVSLAVLGDDHRSWRPERFGWNRWGCRSELRFPTVKLIDFRRNDLELLESDNPLAWVVQAHLATRATRKAPLDRLAYKTSILRRLVLRGLDRQTVLDLYRFIDWVLRLPPELEERFWEAHQRFEEGLPMRYVTNAERFGMERGRREGAARLVERQLLRRFGELSENIRQRLTSADSQDLDRWADRVLEAESLAEVFDDVE